MNNCKEMEEVLSEMVFGDVSHEEQEKLHSHLAECDGCMKFYLSLNETLADTEGVELISGLSAKQKGKIFAVAKKFDEVGNAPIKKFKWSVPLSIAAALVVCGLLITSNMKVMHKEAAADANKDYESSDYDEKKKVSHKTRSSGDG